MADKHEINISISDIKRERDLLIRVNISDKVTNMPDVSNTFTNSAGESKESVEKLYFSLKKAIKTLQATNLEITNGLSDIAESFEEADIMMGNMFGKN